VANDFYRYSSVNVDWLSGVWTVRTEVS